MAPPSIYGEPKITHDTASGSVFLDVIVTGFFFFYLLFFLCIIMFLLSSIFLKLTVNCKNCEKKFEKRF